MIWIIPVTLGVFILLLWKSVREKREKEFNFASPVPLEFSKKFPNVELGKSGSYRVGWDILCKKTKVGELWRYGKTTDTLSSLVIFYEGLDGSCSLYDRLPLWLLNEEPLSEGEVFLLDNPRLSDMLTNIQKGIYTVGKSKKEYLRDGDFW